MPTPKEILAQNVSESETSTGYIDTFDLFNVRRYGAVPGTADSQGTAINACITACINAGSKVVYFPTGIYMSTALVSNYTDVYLVGDNASFNPLGNSYTITQVFETTSIPALYADDLSQDARISKIESTVDNIITRLEKVESTVDNIDTRLEKIESTVDNIDTRLETVEDMKVLNTAGDLLYYSSDDIYERLPIGSSDQLLTVDAGKPTWKDPSVVDLDPTQLLSYFLC